MDEPSGVRLRLMNYRSPVKEGLTDCGIQTEVVLTIRTWLIALNEKEIEGIPHFENNQRKRFGAYIYN